MTTDPKPTKESIKQLLTNRRSLYSQKTTEQEKDNRYYEGTDALGIDPGSGYHEVRTGTARAIIEVPAHRLLGIPHDESKPRKAAKAFIEANTKRKLFIDGFIDYLMQQSPNPIKTCFKKQLLRGEGYYFVLLDESRWEKEPERKEGEGEDDFEKRHERWELDCIDNFPIEFKSPDAMNIYPSQDHVRGVPRDVIIEYPRTVGEVKAKYPKWSNPKKRTGSTVQWVEYWSKDYRAYWADWEPVLVSEYFEDGILPNTWGFVPSVHIFGGFGIEDPDGKPEILARSLLYAYRSRITALQRAVSFQDSDVALHSHRTGVVKHPQGGAEAEAEARKYAAEITHAPGQQRVEVADGPAYELDEGAPINEALFAQSQYLQSLIEQSSHISLLSGYTPRSVTSGVQQGMALGWARADYEDAIRNQEAGLSVAIGMVLRLIETVLKKPVTVRATVVEEKGETRQDIVLKPEDIDSFYTVDMKFRAEDRAAADVRKMTGLRAKNEGILSHRTVLGEYWDVDDPEAELIQIYAEREIEENPILRAQRNKMAARKWGMDESEIRAAEEQEARRRTPAPGTIYGPQGEPLAMARGLPVRRHRRGLEEPELAGGPGSFPMERIQGLGE